MTFLYPFGLLGLIGVPVIILIYILKNKYTEQVIGSSYIWNLSEKFLKKRKPVSRLAGIISLILQVLSIICVSLIIAHPVLSLKNQARDYCFILDGSGSMNMNYSDSSTMFEEGKDRIKKIVSSSKNGSTYTLILASDEVNVITEGNDDKETFYKLLENLSSSDTVSSSNKSLIYAQTYFNSNPSMEMYLVTNKEYETSNIELIDVSSDIVNYALDHTTYTKSSTQLKVSGEVTSYYSDADLVIGFYLNGNKMEEKNISVKKEETISVEFTSSQTDFDEISLKIENDDSLKKDNENIIYNVVKEHERSVLLVSDRPFYLKSALETNGTADVKIVSTSEYSASMRGYGLYIFDSYSPNEYPSDGSIWLFNVSTNTESTGFSFQDEVTFSDDDYALLEYENGHSSVYKELTNDIPGNKIYVNHYLKYSLYRNFTTLLSYDEFPMVFAGTNEYNNREVVFAFDLHQSNLPLLLDYPMLINNFCEYSFPTIIEEESYYAGDTLSLNIVSGTKSIKVISPSGEESYLNVNGDIAEFVTSEAGSYTILVNVSDEVKTFKAYVKVPVSVSENEDNLKEYKLNGEKESSYRDGIYDKLSIILVILLVALCADWGVYCYEQYQLR